MGKRALPTDVFCFPSDDTVLPSGPYFVTYRPNNLRAVFMRPFQAAGTRLDVPPRTAILRLDLQPSVRSAGQIFIAIDDENHRIPIRGFGLICGSLIFAIMKILIEASMKERSKPGLRRNYKWLASSEIAERLQIDNDESVRHAVKRARKKLAEAAKRGLIRLDRNSVIDSSQDGYRLNPFVEVVTLEELQ
jgi:hypothetical protein